MTIKSYVSTSAAVILQAVEHGYKYGFDIMDITGLPSGTVYPALRKLEEAKLLTSKWEKQSIAQKGQRPPRKYYEITTAGREALAEAVKRYRFLTGSIAEPSAKPKPSRS